MEEVEVVKAGSSLVLVRRYLDSWKLSYSASLSPDPRYKHVIHATLGKPRPDTPCPLAVVHIKFTLREDLREIQSYEIEGERHIYRLRDNIQFDERLLDRVVRRKIALKQSGMLDLTDDYIDSRVPEPKYESDAKDNDDANTDAKSDTTLDAKTDAKDDASTDDMDAIEARLLKFFHEGDLNNDGSLTYLEFRTILKRIQRDMRKEEIDLLFTQADVDGNCRIVYEEFVVFAMDILRRLSRGREYQDRFEDLKDDYKALLSEELEPTINVLRQAFDAADYVPPNAMGRTRDFKLSYDLFFKCLSSPLANLSREEINMMIALSPMDDDGKFEYAGFEKTLYEAMYRVSQSQSLALATDIEPYLVESFAAAHAAWARKLDDGLEAPAGRLPRTVLFDALHALKRLMLNRIQCIVVIGLAVPDGDDGLVDYAAFATRAAPKIRELIHPNHLSRRLRMARTDEATIAAIFRGVDDAAGLESVLVETFKREDTDHDGVLGLDEFRAAMAHTTLDLNDEQIASMMVAADVNGDGYIDYAEFVQFAVVSLVQLKKEDRLLQIAEAKEHDEDDDDAAK
ncbi:ChlRe radial spoke protein 7-like protein [Achlya hypogyna]|uniref:Calmodulin n=1 Tax=Achlya hypogyna TaxID=1202772 RepID=A0A1V9YBQ7_ACHHY|nr:ChlRe radial spoke protein 7-like protein [Achlya hypogyna]